MTEHTDYGQAHRLIESVFGDITVSAEDMPRARDAVGIFTQAADAYERGDRHTTARLLSAGIDGASDPALAAHDVAAAGAVAVAYQVEGLICRCGETDCTGVATIEIRAESTDAVHRAAEAMVNVAAAQKFELLTDMLHRFYQESTRDELCTLVAVLVSLRGCVAQLVTRR